MRIHQAVMPVKKNIPSNQFTSNNRVKLIRGGSEYFSTLLELIEKAFTSIHIQTYIFDDDDTGRLIADALKKAVIRNVKVYLLTDGYASQVMSKSFISGLKNAGIKFRFFEPVFRSRYFYFGRRMHHKVVVIDAAYALVGGVNIANRYNDLPDDPAWLDFALLAEGEVATDLCEYCVKTWKGYFPGSDIISCEAVQTGFAIPEEELAEVRMRRNDWVLRKNEISGTYISMLRNAQKEVTILCSYFLPGKIIRRQIVNAIKRGVVIRVIAAGPSDVMLAKNAERWLYDWLLRNGIELYEYQKNILHGKIAVCDDQWMTIGSYNINNISAYASIELNLDVRNAAFTKSVRLTLEDILVSDCERITKEHHVETNNIFKQFIRWFSYQFIRTVFHLFTFYFKQRS